MPATARPRGVRGASRPSCGAGWEGLGGRVGGAGVCQGGAGVRCQGKVGAGQGGRPPGHAALVAPCLPLPPLVLLTPIPCPPPQPPRPRHHTHHPRTHQQSRQRLRAPRVKVGGVSGIEPRAWGSCTGGTGTRVDTSKGPWGLAGGQVVRSCHESHMRPSAGQDGQEAVRSKHGGRKLPCARARPHRTSLHGDEEACLWQPVHCLSDVLANPPTCQ